MSGEVFQAPGISLPGGYGRCFGVTPKSNQHHRRSAIRTDSPHGDVALLKVSNPRIERDWGGRSMRHAKGTPTIALHLDVCDD